MSARALTLSLYGTLPNVRTGYKFSVTPSSILTPAGATAGAAAGLTSCETAVVRGSVLAVPCTCAIGETFGCNTAAVVGAITGAGLGIA